MKKLITLILLITSLPAFSFELDSHVSFGFAYRIDTENIAGQNDSPEEYDKKRNENNDTGSFFLKYYGLSSESSSSKFLFAGLGVHYQLNDHVDYSFSPVAFKDQNGLTFSLDIYQKSKEKGGAVGFGIGWSF